MSIDEDARLARRIDTVLAGRYRLVRLLGRGGMGAVYEALHIETRRRVAVKLAIGDRARRPELIARLRREARAAARIEHPNIAQVLDFGIEPDGTAFLVQEFLAGEDLEARMDRVGAIAPREALELIVPVMGALVAAHRHGLIHRDVKPSNIFLARSARAEPRVVLLDFGLAKSIDPRASAPLTVAGAVLGTPTFMAPEQVRGDEDVGPGADIWAIGVVLFEMLSGTPMFDVSQWPALVHAILVAPIPRLRDRAPAVPAPLAAVVQRALERDRRQRFATMGAFVECLLDAPGFHAEPWHETLRRTHRSAPNLDPPTWTVDAILDDGPTTIRAADSLPDARATVLDPRPRRDDSGSHLVATTRRATQLSDASVRWIAGASLCAAFLAVLIVTRPFRRLVVPDQRPHSGEAARPATVAPESAARPAPAEDVRATALVLPPPPAIASLTPPPHAIVSASTRRTGRTARARLVVAEHSPSGRTTAPSAIDRTRSDRAGAPVPEPGHSAPPSAVPGRNGAVILEAP